MPIIQSKNILQILSTHPLVNLSAEIAWLCKPLELFHIHHFTYQKQFNDGSRISLSNKPQWIEDYYNLGLFQSSLFEDKPTKYASTFNIWIGDYDIDVYHHGRKYYNTSHSITISEPCHDGCEHYLFSTTPQNQLAIQFLANNINILYRFILYLKENGEIIFKSAHNNKIIIPKSLQKFKICQNVKSSYSSLHIAKKIFCRNTLIHRYHYNCSEFKKIKLTQREVMCIIYLLLNKTAFETAKLTNLSPRTVEFYLDNIKAKLNCSNKIDLINKLKKDKYLMSLLDV